MQALGLQDLGLLLALGAQDFRRAHAFGFEDRGALFALGLHLPGHRVDDVGRRADVLHLDAGDLDAPGFGRMVDDGEQPGIDLVALGQGLVEVHRAHHGAQVGRRERHDARV